MQDGPSSEIEIMNKFTLALTCCAVLLGACRYTASTGGAVSGPDPALAEYPRVFWMCGLYEVPVEVELAPDGTLRRAEGRASGFAEVPSAGLNGIFASIEKYPGTRFIAAPAFLTQPGEVGHIAANDLDKAGASIGPREIKVRGTPAAAGLSYELDLTTAPGAGCGSGLRQLPSGSAVLLLCRGEAVAGPLTLLVLRPSVLHSPSDHPYQSAAAGAAE
jgi:hypothetical protein